MLTGVCRTGGGSQIFEPGVCVEFGVQPGEVPLRMLPCETPPSPGGVTSKKSGKFSFGRQRRPKFQVFYEICAKTQFLGKKCQGVF